MNLRAKWRQRRGVSSNPRSADKAAYLVAEPGYPNFGDELIAREWLRYLAQVAPRREVIVDCARPGPASMILRGTHPRVVFTDTLRRLSMENSFPYDGPIESIAQFVTDSLNNEGISPQYAAGIRALQHDVSSIHLLGGGYMRGDWTCNLSRLAVGPWAKAHGIPARVTGVGLMPIEGESLKFARRMAASFDLFSVRDERTMDVINGDNSDVAMLAPDDCFVNGLEHCYMTGEPLPDTMLCIQSDFIEDANALHRHVAKMLATWHVKATDPIGVVECNPRIDRPIFDYLAAQGFSRLRFYPLAEVLECGFPAREGQRWISTRYHPHVLAAALGCSGSFICVDQQYYGIKHAAVLRMGSHWSASPLGESVPQAGQGFADTRLRFDYARRIQKSVAPLYTTQR